MLPLRDNNPTHRTPWVTIALIGVCVAIYFFVQPSGQGSLLNRDPTAEVVFNVEHAAIPCEIIRGRPLSEEEVVRTFTRGETDACEASPSSPAAVPHKAVYLALLYSMFLHGGLVHLGGNMLFLWVFGNNIEDRLGHGWYLIFYLAAGLAATVAHVAVDPNSTVPVVGASGAIAGVMGAYLVLHPRVRIHTLLFLGFLLFFREIPAWVLLGFWLVSQFFLPTGSGVAWVAHVGGFVFGALVGLALRGSQPERHDGPVLWV